MATGGEVGGQTSANAGSEDLADVKCQPCHEEGEIRDAVGICLNCQDYLCRRCFDGHRIPRPCRNHQLLDTKQMLEKNVKLKRKDKCTRECPLHDDDVIKYYCIEHGQLGCNVCLSLNHRTCEPVQYIPDAAKDLDNNTEFNQAQTCLDTALGICKRISQIGNQTVESIQASYVEALANVENHRREINQALDKIQTGIVEKAEAMKTNVLHKVTNVMDKYQHANKDLQQMRLSLEQLRQAYRNCDLYTEMMSVKDKLNTLLTELKEVERELVLQGGNEIHFTANPELLKIFQAPKIFGKLTYAKESVIVEAKLELEIDLKCTTGVNCSISGVTLLSDKKILITDWGNDTVKAVDTTLKKVVANLKMSAGPWEICKIQTDQVAVTLTAEQTIAFVTVGDRDLKVDRTLKVDGACRGIDFKDEKLAVSFCRPDKVQIITLEGSVLHHIPIDAHGKTIFSTPYHIKFDQDSASLFVSNSGSLTLMRVAFDGTILSAFSADREFRSIRGMAMDRAGNIYLCGLFSIHKVSSNLKKSQIILKVTESYHNAQWSISYSATEKMFYVGGSGSNTIGVYRAICE